MEEITVDELYNAATYFRGIHVRSRDPYEVYGPKATFHKFVLGRIIITDYDKTLLKHNFLRTNNNNIGVELSVHPNIWCS